MDHKDSLHVQPKSAGSTLALAALATALGLSLGVSVPDALALKSGQQNMEQMQSRQHKDMPASQQDKWHEQQTSNQVKIQDSKQVKIQNTNKPKQQDLDQINPQDSNQFKW